MASREAEEERRLKAKQDLERKTDEAQKALKRVFDARHAPDSERDEEE